MVIYLAVNGYLDDVAADTLAKFEPDYLKFMRSNYAEIAKSIREKKALTPEIETALQKAIKEFKDTFATFEKNGEQSAVR